MGQSSTVPQLYLSALKEVRMTRVRCENVDDIDDHKPQFVLQTDGAFHVVPKSFFEDVINGKIEFTELDGHKEIIKLILSEWLKYSPDLKYPGYG